MKQVFIYTIIAAMMGLAVACGPTQDSLKATETNMAAEVLSTQTAIIHTPLPTAVLITAENAGQLSELLREGNGRFSSIAFSPNGKTLAARGSLGISLLEQGTLELMRYIEHTSSVISVAWSPDGSQIVSVSDDGTIRVWALPDE